MRIGIFPDLNGLSGGIYQYGLTMLHALRELKSSIEDDFVIFAHEGANQQSAGLWNAAEWPVKPVLPPSARRRAFSALRRINRQGWAWKAFESLRAPVPTAWRRDGDATFDPDRVRPRPEIGRWLRRCGVELMLYPSTNTLSFETGLPYVMAIHDIQHRLQPEFPEVSANGEWQRREYLFRNAARYATLLLADSEVGKEDLLNVYGEYGVTPDRVKVLPFLPAPYLTTDIAEEERRRVFAHYRLPEQYLFYPAQFWPHKNHVRIVEALGLLKQERRLKPSIVFCGSAAGEIRERTFLEVQAQARRLGVERQIHCLGYVRDEEMSSLYAGATALVMPTLFGPTNIPVLEAWAMNCPVLTSDLRGIREHAADAALLVNPRSAEAIAEGISRLWEDATLRGALACRGRQRLESYGHSDYRKRLRGIIKQAKEMVRMARPSGVAS